MCVWTSAKSGHQHVVGEAEVAQQTNHESQRPERLHGAEIEEAVKFAKESPYPDEDNLMDYVFS